MSTIQQHKWPAAGAERLKDLLAAEGEVKTLMRETGSTGKVKRERKQAKTVEALAAQPIPDFAALEPGAALVVIGQAGEFRFVKYDADRKVVSMRGGERGREKDRAFVSEKVRLAHVAATST